MQILLSARRSTHGPGRLRALAAWPQGRPPRGTSAARYERHTYVEGRGFVVLALDRRARFHSDTATPGTAHRLLGYSKAYPVPTGRSTHRLAADQSRRRTSANGTPAVMPEGPGDPCRTCAPRTVRTPWTEVNIGNTQLQHLLDPQAATVQQAKDLGHDEVAQRRRPRHPVPVDQPHQVIAESRRASECAARRWSAGLGASARSGTSAR